ncbi:hypothetical protein [Alphaentomopoxvirus acuprea]|uniref:Uncharacterized protein n=1 Tax=Alphaentomopoxvirus acuprea TaxID=62099 RepID=W6JIV3_9POXV|nr:hypothetical protein BA82_gp158 [Anomala cuprea entomopoxvirus]BAO49518.1 hypothetical protein [Anomala cuprea entomopoxvirus]
MDLDNKSKQIFEELNVILLKNKMDRNEIIKYVYNIKHEMNNTHINKFRDLFYTKYKYHI